jgi:hypothetical protein
LVAPSIPIGVNGDGYQQPGETNPMAIWSEAAAELERRARPFTLTLFLGGLFGQVYDLRGGSMNRPGFDAGFMVETSPAGTPGVDRIGHLKTELYRHHREG